MQVVSKLYIGVKGTSSYLIFSRRVQDLVCMYMIEDSWGICYFRSAELAAAVWDKHIVFHNNQAAVFRLVTYNGKHHTPMIATSRHV